MSWFTGFKLISHICIATSNEIIDVKALMTQYFAVSQRISFKFAYFNENLNKVHLSKSYFKKLLLIASLYSFFDFNKLNSKNHVLRIFFVGTYSFLAEEGNSAFKLL